MLNNLNNKELFPIYGLWHKPFWQTKLFYFIVGSIILFIILVFVLLLIRRYLKKKCTKMVWEKALFDLSNLEKLIVKNKISSKNFYLLLTEIIKKYLYNRFGYDLFGCTDQEVILFLEDKNFDKDLLENIADMFESMQVVKFAAQSVVKELMERDLARSIDLVKKTIPKHK